MMRTLCTLATIGLLALGGTAMGSAPIAFAQHDDHAGHDHAAHAGQDAHAGDVHVGHDAHATAGHDAHAAGPDDHGHHEATFADVNWFDLGGGVVNFGLLIAVLFLILRGSLPAFLASRRASVVDGMEEAKRLKAAADAKYAEYSARIENLDTELERLREELRRAGMDERDRIVADASKKAEKMREEARFLIDQQMKQLRQDLTREAIEAAIGAAETVLTQGTTAQDQERLAKGYLGTIRTTVAKKTEEKSL